MNDPVNAFLDTLRGDEGKEILALGEKIKELSRKTDKKLGILRLFTILSLTVIGFIAFRIIGAVLFFFIAFISNFFLLLSSKKNIMLRYFTYYRSRVPRLIAMTAGIEVKSEEYPDEAFPLSLFEGAELSYRMSHRYGDLYMGYAKFSKNGTSVSEGLIYITEGESPNALFESALEKEFPTRVLKSENGRSLLYLEGISDYLSGSVDMKDDLSENALLRQLDYYLLGDAFKKAARGEEFNIDTIFHEI